MDMGSTLLLVTLAVVVVFIIGFFALLVNCYHKAEQGKVLIRTGGGAKPKVSFTGLFVIPVLHKLEILDISVKRVEIERSGKDGLICKDNMRADIKVAFFVRVNHTVEDVLKVAQSIGVNRASDGQAIIELFDAKFSEGLKTVGKNFDFVELYQSRALFKDDILQVIGTDLNGYVLDDAAIDYLEQTEMEFLRVDNILDAEGIKKITDLTARQRILANQIDRDREKTIKQQDVDAAEAILEMDRQLAESTQKQKREIAAVTAREEAETRRVQEEERLKSDSAHIRTEEELRVAEENKDRQIIVAQKNKQRTDAIETERIEKDRMLEVIERDRITDLAKIEKDRAVEVERKNIQDVIRERVVVEKAVVEEEERIKDTRAFAEADRTKKVAVTQAEKEAEEAMVKRVKAAEAEKNAAKLSADQKIIEAEAARSASDKEAEARKVLAEAKAQEEAVMGMSEVKVMEAKADATEKFGSAEAAVTERKALAYAKQGEAEAQVTLKKSQAEAEGIREKAEAMKDFDGPGREHEEFKLRLNLDRDITLAQISAQERIAHDQAGVLAKGLEQANIDIVGGESMFLDRLMGSITGGKSIDRLVEGSNVLRDVKNTFFNGDGNHFKQELKQFIDRFGVSSEDIKNLTMSTLLAKLIHRSDSDKDRHVLGRILSWVESAGASEKKVGDLLD